VSASEREVLTPKQAAELLGISDAELRRRVARGLIPCAVIGKNLKRFSRKALIELTPERIAERAMSEQNARVVAEVVAERLQKWMDTIAAPAIDPEVELHADEERLRSQFSCWDLERPIHRRGVTYVLQWRGMPMAPIKIGKADDLMVRVLDIQRMSPVPLQIMTVLHGKDWETPLHRRFAQERQHGEWFSGVRVQRWVDSHTLRSRCEACSQ
jgi:hypothetical protein